VKNLSSANIPASAGSPVRALVDRAHAAAALDSSKSAPLLPHDSRVVLESVALELVTDAVIITDRAGIILWVNAAFTTVTGYTADEVLGKTPRVLKSGEHDPAFYELLWKTILSGQTWRGEFVNRRKDGTLFQSEHTISPVRAGAGMITHFVAVLHEVTERKRLQREVISREQRLESFFANAPAGLCLIDLDFRFIRANSVLAEINGKTPEEHAGRPIREVLPELAPVIEPLLRQVVETGKAITNHEISGETARAPGQKRYWLVSYFPVAAGEGKIRALGAMVVEITALKRIEQELRGAEERFRQIAENVQEVFWIVPVDRSGLLYVSPAFEAIWGRTPASLYANPGLWLEAVLPEDRPGVQAALDKGMDDVYHREYRIRRPDGEIRWVLDRGFPVRDDSGKLVRVVGIARDITERKHSDERLAAHHEVVQVLAAGGSLRDAGRRILEIICQKLGWDAGAIWLNDSMVRRVVCVTKWPRPEPREETASEAVATVAQTGSAKWFSTGAKESGNGPAAKTCVAFSIKLAGKTLGVVELFADGTRPEDDKLLSMFAMMGDQLGQFIDRKQIEEQLLHAQKMEAIGTMAGGIAHDFNNILTAIYGFAELLSEDLPAGSPAADAAAEIVTAAHRARDLVARILAFSRKQPQDRKVIKLQPVIAEAASLLRASLPATIEINPDVDAGCGFVMADPTQIHQVLMNLATNAAHAMRGNGGRLDIRLKDVTVDADQARTQTGLKPGRFVLLRIADTGCGIDPASLGRIFDPFFTTKGPGEGTGLGLSVVHGIVQNHDGLITVESEVGKGTTFEIHLPLVDCGNGEEELKDGPLPRGNGEEILVLDDEPAVCDLARRLLENLGYKPTVFQQGDEALASFQEQTERFAAVISDLTMPHMTGVSFASEIQRIRPGTPIILVTGYFGHVDMAHTQAAGICDILAKPFSTRALASTLARALKR